MPPRSDPLEGLESRPVETQVAVLANEMRNERNELSGLRDELQRARSEISDDLRGCREDVAGIRKALWTVALSVTGSVIVFAATIFTVFK